MVKDDDNGEDISMNFLVFATSQQPHIHLRSVGLKWSKPTNNEFRGITVKTGKEWASYSRAVIDKLVGMGLEVPKSSRWAVARHDKKIMYT